MLLRSGTLRTHKQEHKDSRHAGGQRFKSSIAHLQTLTPQGLDASIFGYSSLSIQRLQFGLQFRPSSSWNFNCDTDTWDVASCDPRPACLCQSLECLAVDPYESSYPLTILPRTRPTARRCSSAPKARSGPPARHASDLATHALSHHVGVGVIFARPILSGLPALTVGRSEACRS
jgi:hypothetical protein